MGGIEKISNSILIIIILILICILGYIYNINIKKDINNRMKFIEDYHSKFVEYVKKIFSSDSIDAELYAYLTKNVNKVQNELGHDGVFDYVKDNLNNTEHLNYQMIINILPETRSSQMSFPIFRERVLESCKYCEDALIRHKGTIDTEFEKINKSLSNPLVLFKDGISLILYVPVYVLNLNDVISNEKKKRIINNPLMKVISMLVSFIVFLSAIVSLVAGWDYFINIFNFIK